MSIETKEEMFLRELRKLYHAELEILDLHRDLSTAAASEEVSALFASHRDDTTVQINRIEAMFEMIGAEPSARASPIMEGLVAEKDEFIEEVESDELRDIDAIGIGTINERIEITLLDRLILLATELDYPDDLVDGLRKNRSEAESALAHMRSLVAAERS